MKGTIKFHFIFQMLAIIISSSAQSIESMGNTLVKVSELTDRNGAFVPSVDSAQRRRSLSEDYVTVNHARRISHKKKRHGKSTKEKQKSKSGKGSKKPSSKGSKKRDTQTALPTLAPTSSSTQEGSPTSTASPTTTTTFLPTVVPPTLTPTIPPMNQTPTFAPTTEPILPPISQTPTISPIHVPTWKPTNLPTRSPSKNPSNAPTGDPTRPPTRQPSRQPTDDTCSNTDLEKCCSTDSIDSGNQGKICRSLGCSKRDCEQKPAKCTDDQQNKCCKNQKKCDKFGCNYNDC